MDSAFRRSYAAVEEALANALGSEAGVDAGRAAEELWAVTRAIEGSPALRRSLADPSREGADKAALAEQLFRGKVGEGALFLTRAVAAQRWGSEGDLVTALERIGVEAMLAQAERHGRLGQVEDELFRFSRIVTATPELQAALGDRRADAGAKTALVDRLLSVKTAPETVSLARQAVSSVRGRRFDKGLRAYLEQAAQRQDQVTATVTSAVPLSPEQHDRLTTALSQQYGRQVHTNVVIDEHVVGGIRVEIGDEVIDGTVSQKLSDARRTMTS
jgi:F-type H+-transporting ATPase subunit delta